MFDTQFNLMKGYRVAFAAAAFLLVGLVVEHGQICPGN